MSTAVYTVAMDAQKKANNHLQKQTKTEIQKQTKTDKNIKIDKEENTALVSRNEFGQDVIKEQGLEIVIKILGQDDIAPSEIVKQLKGLGIHANVYSCVNNPYLNDLIANETGVLVMVHNFIKGFNKEINTEMVDWEGKTALITAAKIWSMHEVIGLLLSHCNDKIHSQNKINIDAQDNEGRTALHYVIAYGDFESTKLLLQNKASLKITDKFGRTPLNYLDLDPNELSSILKSASIEPNRDFNAEVSHLPNPDTLLYGSDAIIFNKEGIQKFKTRLQDATLMRWEMNLSEAERKNKREELLLRLEKLKAGISEKSVLETCLEKRTELKKRIKGGVKGAVSSLDF